MLTRLTIECASSALRVVYESLNEPSPHFSRATQRKHQAEIQAALAELSTQQPAADWMHTFPPEWDRHPWANYAHLVASSGMDGIHFMWYYCEREPKWGKLSYNWVGGKWGYKDPALRAPLSLFFDTRATLTQRPGQGTSR